MEISERLEELLLAAESCGIEIRRTPLGGQGGGLCEIRGARVLFVDTLAEAETSYERTIEALAGVPELDGCFLRPEIREELDRIRIRES